MTLTDAERIVSLEKRMAARDSWAAEHDGRIGAWWEAQHAWNGKAEKMHATFTLRLSALERKIMWIAGFSAAIGAVAGNLLSNLQLT